MKVYGGAQPASSCGAEVPRNQRPGSAKPLWGAVARLQLGMRTRASANHQHTVPRCRAIARAAPAQLVGASLRRALAMADRAGKRLRRLSTDYDDSEGADDWALARDAGSSNQSRYVADPRSEAASPGRPPCATWERARLALRLQPAPLSEAAPRRSPPRRAAQNTPVPIPALERRRRPPAAALAPPSPALPEAYRHHPHAAPPLLPLPHLPQPCLACGRAQV